MPTLTQDGVGFLVRSDLSKVRETLTRIRECERLAPLNLFGRRAPATMFDYLDRRSCHRASVEMPVYVTPVDFDGQYARPTNNAETESFAFTKEVSLRGIGFTHDAPLESDYCVITFDLLSGESVSMLLEIRWANREEDFELMSGGRFLGIVESSFM